MLHKHKFIIDATCEVYDLLAPIVAGEFFNLDNHNFVSGSIYIVSYHHFNKNEARFREAISQGVIPHVVLCHAMEGSETLVHHCSHIVDLIIENKIWLISGGDMDTTWPYILFDNFLPKVHNFKENITEISRSQEIFNKLIKPYKFLFLNGRLRHHRRYLLEKFKYNGILSDSLWTNLEEKPTTFWPFQLPTNINILNSIPRKFPMQSLPSKYEIGRYQHQLTKPLINTNCDLYFKYHLFNNEWGDIYLNADPYIDTYFSLVTETVFTYPYSFRTEKIWKPVAMGHPFVIASNYGYYRDLRNLGFKTFNHLIDESFDTIADNQERIDRIATVVEDLCQQDLLAFLSAAEETCKYNQQHLVEMRTKVRTEFPQRFENFINERSRI